MASICLFSCPRPGQSRLKKTRGFLALPGELRNRIYQYYFEMEVRCEVVAQGVQFEQRKHRTVKLSTGAFKVSSQGSKDQRKGKSVGQITIRMSRPLGNYTLVQGLRTNWLASVYALNLVCKQLHTETLSFIYSKTLFVFDASKRITNFFSFVSRSRLEQITKLELHYTTYGCPRLLVERIWQDKHTTSWFRACRMMSKTVVGLRRLKVFLHMNDNPLRFSLREDRLQPLFQFRRLTCAVDIEDDPSQRATSFRKQQRLSVVEVDLKSRQFHNKFNGNRALVKANQDLHQLFGSAIRLAILGAKEEEAMDLFDHAWTETYSHWQDHLGYAKTSW